MTVISSVTSLVPWMQERAAQLDDATALPIEHDVRIATRMPIAWPLS